MTSAGGAAKPGAAQEFAAGDADAGPFDRALEAAIEAAEDPDRVGEISEDLVRPLLEAAEENPEALLGRLAELHPESTTDQLQDMLGRAMFVAEQWGRLSVDADA